MTSAPALRKSIFEEIAKLINKDPREVSADMRLIGGDGVLDSMKLVELCVTLEDWASELGFEFDWTSDTAMSRSRSMFRTAGTLTDEFISQMEARK